MTASTSKLLQMLHFNSAGIFFESSSSGAGGGLSDLTNGGFSFLPTA
jgi:hypothetical protein